MYAQHVSSSAHRKSSTPQSVQPLVSLTQRIDFMISFIPDRMIYGWKNDSR